jgi:hypothetical protein
VLTLQGAVRCAADERQALEQLCRGITRLALANECVRTHAAGQVVPKLKTAWRDGSIHSVMPRLQPMHRLAAWVPRPRRHVIRFPGVLAPNAKLRVLVVPQARQPPAQSTPSADGKATGCARGCCEGSETSADQGSPLGDTMTGTSVERRVRGAACAARSWRHHPARSAASGASRA